MDSSENRTSALSRQNSLILQSILRGIWSDVLGGVPFSDQDDFFDLGGDSLLATRVVATVQQKWGVNVELRAFYEASTIEKLAKFLTDSSDRSKSNEGNVEKGEL